MFKKSLSVLTFCSALLNSVSYAGNTKCEDCHDPFTKNAAALHYTTSKPNSQESKYWDDYIHSGNKDITVYVRDLSRKDAQAALWFITTGGKYGFAAREATAQERVLLEDAIKQVALSYSQQGVKSGRGLQEWSKVSNANHAGHLHLQMIYKQLDDLKKDNADLKVRVKSLEERVSLLEKTNKKADEEKTAADAKLIAQKTEAAVKLAAQKETADAKLAAQQLADKTAADVEKAKVQAEVDRQKARKKVYKDQVIEYKLKAVEAEKAKAVSDAVENEKKTAAETLKLANESAAKEREAAAKVLKEKEETAAKVLKETEETAAKVLKEEREAATEREKILLQKIAAYEAIQENVRTGIGSNSANNNNSSSPFGTRQRSQGAQETRQYDYDFHATVTETAKVDRTATQNR